MLIPEVQRIAILVDLVDHMKRVPRQTGGQPTKFWEKRCTNFDRAK